MSNLSYPMYYVIDTTPDKRCASFIEKEHGNIMSNIIKKNQLVAGGDALLLRDWLQEAGFIFSKDFYLEKVIKTVGENG